MVAFVSLDRRSGRRHGRGLGRGAAVAVLLLGWVRPSLSAQEPAYTGFADDSAERQRLVEERLQAIVDPASLRSVAEVLGAVPHVAGGRRQRETARYVDSLTGAWGLRGRIDSALVYLPQPIAASLTRLAPTELALTVTEPILPEDPATHVGVFPAFSAYSGRGAVRGEVVYANYGLIEDYARLDSLGVSAAGKIVVARYGRSFRGIKAREAERQGARGLVLYSDPADDGYVRGDVYPEGRYRPGFGVERGSIKNGAGDPSTPGWPSTFDARRVPEAQMEGIARIPVLPVGYAAAAELLEDLRGAPLPEQSWQGGLPFRYHVGPGPVEARLVVRTEAEREAYHPIYNTVAVLEGTTYPGEWVVLGGHRDSWGPGAMDNVSGTASVLEAARAFAELAAAGHRPKRTIVFATWDAEEWGLIGSTEWVEERAGELEARVVAYVNQDVVATGPDFSASAAGPLKGVIREAMRAVRDPFDRSVSVYHRWQARTGAPGEMAPVGDLGGGSDYAAFYNHLGIPSANLGFGGGGGGVYHSAYDSNRWMRQFGDPGYRGHAGAAAAAAVLVARLANADVLPFDYLEFADQLADLADHAALQLGTGAFEADVAALREAVAGFREAAGAFTDARVRLLAAGRPEDWQRMNARLLAVDRALTRDIGLHGRPWMRNLIFAADRDNGYGNMPFPSILEAVRDGDADGVGAETADLARHIDRAAAVLRQAAATSSTPH